MKRIFLCVLMTICLILSSCGTSSSGTSGESGGTVETASESETNSESSSESSSSGTEFEITPQSTINMLEATDSFGRWFGPMASTDSGKTIGLFYFLWMGQHDNGCVFDNNLESETNLKNDNSTQGVFHYWNKPLYGYYDSEDEWVFRKHMELLTMCGVDYIAFDVSNGYYYPEVCDRIFPVALELRKQGWDIPRLVFYCHNRTKDTVTGIYDRYYNPNTVNGRKYAGLWYNATDNGERNTENKPWIIVKNNGFGDGTAGAAQNYSECREDIKNFFYTRELVWGDENSAEYNFASDIDNPSVHGGMISVSTAQHTSGAFSDSLYEANGKDVNRGRGWSGVDKTNDITRIAQGTNFEEEWDYAVNAAGVNSIFLSTWNEWVAQKQPRGLYGRSTCYFVDQFNNEFSRDCDLVDGEWGDAYYLQMMRRVRQFKEKASANVVDPISRTVSLDGAETEWLGTVGYLDFTGDTADRNYHSSNYATNGSVPNVVYTNTTGRNDISKVNVTYDNDYLYFRVECADNITAYTPGDKTWMNVLIEVDGQRGSAWNYYQYVINRTVTSRYTMVERLSENGNSEVKGVAEYGVNGKIMTVKIPRSLLGIADGGFTINFKVADNVTNYKDIMDYYVNGDSAPIGRLNYSFTTGA